MEAGSRAEGEGAAWSLRADKISDRLAVRTTRAARQVSWKDWRMTVMTAVHIRWMIRRDLPEVLAIEAASFEFPWSEEDFVQSQRQRNSIGMVVEHDERVVGFMIYELDKARIHLVNLAVAPDMRRKGVGAFMVGALKLKLSTQRRKRIVLEVREANLGAHLFFRRQGFRATAILRHFFDDTPEDAYQFRFTAGGGCHGLR